MARRDGQTTAAENRGDKTAAADPTRWMDYRPFKELPPMQPASTDVAPWYFAFLAGGVENFSGMATHGGTQEARDNQRLVIGPWDHVDWGRPDDSRPRCSSRSAESPTVRSTT